MAACRLQTYRFLHFFLINYYKKRKLDAVHGSHVLSCFDVNVDITLSTLFLFCHKVPTQRVSLSSAGARSGVTTPGSNVSLSCKTDSANPAAKLKWQRNGAFVNDSSSTYSTVASQQDGENNGFVSLSKLTFVANDQLLGSVFHCVAIHQYSTMKSNGFVLLSKCRFSLVNVVADMFFVLFCFLCI